jgi:arylsulfatase A-like enzyme
MTHRRPNILWIVSEDCPPWFGIYGDRLARTPNLDALAARGVRYSRAYSVAPVCAPSRFSLLTGVSVSGRPQPPAMTSTCAMPAATC